MLKVGASDLPGVAVDPSRPTVLFAEHGHAIYWLGFSEITAFRCNAYLLRDGDAAVLFDPGGAAYFRELAHRVAQILPPQRVTGMVLSHQDPDVAASMVHWLELNPRMRVFTTPRTQILLPYYGRSDYRYCNVAEGPRFPLPSGAALDFIEAPFLHFPGAIATYDTASRYLLSGDIWAALDLDWALIVSSFADHVPKMNLFHLDYMTSNVAARGFARKIERLPIDAILPQHGSLITAADVPAALAYLRELQCGTDIIYADLA